MDNWEQCRQNHLTDETYDGHRVLWVEAFGKRFKVLDTAKTEATDRGPYDGPCAATFYDEEPVFHYLSELKPRDVFVDVGANIGSYTLPALALGARVFAFEPSNQLRDILEINTEINGWQNSCIPYDYLMGDGMQYPDGLSKYLAENGLGPPVGTWTIDAMTLTRCDMMKIDVEGLEWHVIQGAKETIERFKPTLLIEDHEGICPPGESVVSDYPKSINSSSRIIHQLMSWGYDVDIVNHDSNRRYIVAHHKDRKLDV